MVIEIKKPITKAKIENAGKLLQKRKTKRGFNANRFFGKIEWGIDGVELQRKLRDEWS